MSKEKVEVILGAAGRSAIVRAFNEALDKAEHTGSLVTEVCETAARYLRGAPMPEKDGDAIVRGIATARGWKGASLKTRKSEVLTLLRAYVSLPEAIKQFRDKSPTCQWHDGVRLARKLNSGLSVPQSVNAMLKQKRQAPAKTSPRDKVVTAMIGWFNKASVPVQADILKAAKLLGIDKDFAIE